MAAASCPTVSIPAAVQRRFGDFADSGNAPHAERREKCFLAPGGNPHQAARLGLIARHFGDQARSREARGARQSGGCRNFAQQRIGRGQRRAVQALRPGEIEISLVHRSHFHDRRIFSENRRDAVAPLGIEMMPRLKKNRVRA